MDDIVASHAKPGSSATLPQFPPLRLVQADPTPDASTLVSHGLRMLTLQDDLAQSRRIIQQLLVDLVGRSIRIQELITERRETRQSHLEELRLAEKARVAVALYFHRELKNQAAAHLALVQALAATIIDQRDAVADVRTSLAKSHRAKTKRRSRRFVLVFMVFTAFCSAFSLYQYNEYAKRLIQKDRAIAEARFAATSSEANARTLEKAVDARDRELIEAEQGQKALQRQVNEARQADERRALKKAARKAHLRAQRLKAEGS